MSANVSQLGLDRQKPKFSPLSRARFLLTSFQPIAFGMLVANVSRLDWKNCYQRSPSGSGKVAIIVLSLDMVRLHLFHRDV